MTQLPTRAPTATELLGIPVVQQELDRAWIDSQAEDPVHRHEEGGWIYMDILTGQIVVRRAPAGIQAIVVLDNPPLVAGSVVVGIFHTHPNPSAAGWYTGPSLTDETCDDRDGVPDLIRADDGIHLSGPKSRRGGLDGGPGYPP